MGNKTSAWLQVQIGMQYARPLTFLSAPFLPWAEAKENPSPPSVTWPTGICGLPLSSSGSPTSENQP